MQALQLARKLTTSLQCMATKIRFDAHIQLTPRDLDEGTSTPY